MKKVYEAWQYDEECIVISFSTAEAIQKELAQGLIPKHAILLHRFEADYWEEAQQIHYDKMGWGKYKPMGEPKECPNDCGAMFYPEGSGECPNCGNIC